AAGEHELAQDVVLHERQEFVDRLVLVVMGVDVDDQHVVELALLRLLSGMGEQAAGVELFDRHAPSAVGDEVHGVSPEYSISRPMLCLLSSPRKRASGASQPALQTNDTGWYIVSLR